jgi:hypothetical protein
MKSLPAILSLLLPAALAAQTPSFRWAVSAGGAGPDKTRIVNVDRAGNVLLAGECTGPAKFGGLEIKGAGKLDFFVAKCDPRGKFLWARTGGGSATDRGYGVAADQDGNVYATGHYESADADFSGTKLALAGGYDAFVAKYDPAGKLLWIRTAGGAGYDYGHAIAIDPQGNAVVAGAVYGNASFGDVAIENPAGGHLFVAKYDPAGKLLWVKTTSGKTSGSGHGVAVDGRGFIYVGGSASGVGEFGGRPIGVPKGGDAVVAKLSPDGKVLWIAQNHGEPRCLVHEITCDAEGRVWASGMFTRKAMFGDETFSTTGEKDNDAFIAHYDTDGKLRWARVGQGPAVDYGLGVATDGKGHSFLAGEFTDAFKLGGATLKSAGSTDIYVAAFDANGTLTWITRAGGEKGENAYSIVHDGRGHLILGGSFAGTAGFGEHQVSSSGGNDLYGAMLQLP